MQPAGRCTVICWILQFRRCPVWWWPLRLPGGIIYTCSAASWIYATSWSHFRRPGVYMLSMREA